MSGASTSASASARRILSVGSGGVVLHLHVWVVRG